MTQLRREESERMMKRYKMISRIGVGGRTYETAIEKDVLNIHTKARHLHFPQMHNARRVSA